MDAFIKRPWEGNVRELENTIMQVILFSSIEQINPGNLELGNSPIAVKQYMPSKVMGKSYKTAKEETLFKFNHTYIGGLLKANNGNITQAAKQCGLERQALQQIIRR